MRISSLLAVLLMLLSLALGGCNTRQGGETAGPASATAPVAVPQVGASASPVVASKKTYSKPSLEDLQRKLTPAQFEVTQKSATEPPFENAYWNNHEAGLYVDVASGEPLFSSLDKFES